MTNGFFALIAEMFSYTFLVRAFVVGVLVSLCAALLGASLVLKRYSMIGDGLSHVGFGALALATALNAAPLAVAVPVVVAAAFLLLRLSESSKIKGDAAIALVSTGSLAAGVMIISRTTGMNTDVCNYLFGSILAMSKSDVRLSAALSVTVLLLFGFFYHKLFAITFDESFARASGLRTGVYNMIIALLTAVTIVLGMRMMGAMLISALIIFPSLASMRIFKTWRGVILSSVCISLACFFTGIIISYVYATPTGASVVLVNIAIFALFFLLEILKKKLPRRSAGAVALTAMVLLGSCGAAASGFAENALSGPAGPAQNLQDSGGGIIEIREKMFITQTNEIYLNQDDYLGKTIRLQGLYKEEPVFGGGEKTYCFVIRYGPGCCGYDGSAGFEIAWDGQDQAPRPRPETDDWVEATGVMQRYEEDGGSYLYLSLLDLQILDTRGAEYVTQ